MTKHIALIRGDGIGPEIVGEAIAVLDAVAAKFGHTFIYEEAPMGGNAIDLFGDPLPQSELEKCLASDSVLLGAVGGPKWNDVPGPMRPEKGLLRLRAGMGVYSNNRPAKIWPQLSSASPLKQEIVDKGIDFIIVRELIGGIYFGKHECVNLNDEVVAIDELRYSEEEIRRIGRIGFETAQKRGKKLCSVEKSNVLDSSRLWKKVMEPLHTGKENIPLFDPEKMVEVTVCLDSGKLHTQHAIIRTCCYLRLDIRFLLSQSGQTILHLLQTFLCRL